MWRRLKKRRFSFYDCRKAGRHSIIQFFQKNVRHWVWIYKKGSRSFKYFRGNSGNYSTGFILLLWHFSYDFRKTYCWKSKCSWYKYYWMVLCKGFFWKKIETLLITFSFQTSPLNAIISPTAVFLYISWIKKNRQMHIRKMTKVNKSENGCHFQQLSVMWNKWILMIFWKMFRTVIWFAMMSASIKNCKINFVNLVTRGFTGKYLKRVNNSLVFTEIYLEFPDFQKFTLCKLISKQQQIFAEKVP